MYVIRHRQPQLKWERRGKGTHGRPRGYALQKAAECGAYDVHYVVCLRTRILVESINGDIARRSALKLGYAAE